ncbi:probable tyrosyl-DNA phosphodiesterase isoform X2 [Odontomachus brunneus]|nr:probable tyrosyl-DNA phosphodiesterase isoform X2 [Odontomachus brunneus]
MSAAVKKCCPFKESCYRKNPIHFSEMSHPHLEKLVINQLDDVIEIPEILNFTCNDRSLLLDQLKVLQMVLRKERDKNRDDSKLATSNELPKAQSLLNDKEDLQGKVDKHKKVMAQKRQDKLKQMDTEAQALSRALRNEHESSENTKTRKRSHSSTGSVTKKMKEINIESSNHIKKNQQIIGDSQSSSTSKEQTDKNKGTNKDTSKGTSIMDMYQACDSEKSRKDVREKAIQMMRRSGYNVSVVEPGEFALKYALSAPYHLFFTRVEKSKETYNQQFSITFPEILDRSLGEIVDSLHLNFMVDVGWLCLQYLLAGQRTDMMILYGDRVDQENLGCNITMIQVDMPSAFGCHHTKIMVLQYKDNGIRVVVSTANLYSDDWENRTQGLWISPHLPLLPESANSTDGESPTNFKKDFERYLSKYRHPALTQWMWAVRKADFSAVNVYFVASVPGTHQNVDVDFWGYRKLSRILSNHATLPPDAPQWSLIAQSSSIGSLGPNYESWLSKEIVPSMSRETTQGLKSHPKFQFIYPSMENYKRSFDFQTLTSCLPYSLKVHSKQQWIESYM